jgi:GAF domain-containing protein
MLAGGTPESTEVAATAESSKEFRVVPEKEVIEAVTREARELRFDSQPEGNTVEEKRPALSMPLKVGDKITGVLTLSGKPEGAEFGEDEARFLSVLGTSLALALENARLFRDLEENAAMLKQLIEVGQLVSSSLEADVLMGYALQSLKEVIGAKWCALRLLDEETGELVLKASLGMSKDLQAEVERVRAEGTILGEVLKTAQPQLVEDLAKCAPSLRLPYYSKEIRSVAVVPVLVRGKVLGTLKVYSSSPRRWNEEESRLPGDHRKPDRAGAGERSSLLVAAGLLFECRAGVGGGIGGQGRLHAGSFRAGGELGAGVCLRAGAWRPRKGTSLPGRTFTRFGQDWRARRHSSQAGTSH